MGVGEAHSLCCQAIQIGRLKFGLRVQATGITDPLIIGVDDDDVRAFVECLSGQQRVDWEDQSTHQECRDAS